MHAHRDPAEARDGQTARSDGRGAFFSLGVDSFFTLRNNHDLTHLVMVKGYDLKRLDEDVWVTMFGNAARVARETERTLVRVDTNVRALPGAGWNWSHGPALAAVAHVLAPTLGRALISASMSYRTLGPWGTHPLLDPLWSSDSVEVQTFGAARTRVEKMTELVDDDLVLDTLRVCLRGDGHEYNCGRCTKCVTMMLVLEAAGKLGRCRTLPDAVDVPAVRRLNLMTGAAFYYFGQAVALLEEAGVNPRLARAAKSRLRYARVKRYLTAAKQM